jgi:bifunctional DNA-binding transcriptional regulator/antitoxin component of YhaV-PrlF toxin-antitoxin module
LLSPPIDGADARWLTILMIIFMIMKRRMKISKGGQISIPASIRHRWATGTVALEDLGDRIIVAPAADDPVTAAEGALADEFKGFDAARLRRRARTDEQVTEKRRSA